MYNFDKYLILFEFVFYQLNTKIKGILSDLYDFL